MSGGDQTKKVKLPEKTSGEKKRGQKVESATQAKKARESREKARSKQKGGEAAAALKPGARQEGRRAGISGDAARKVGGKGFEGKERKLQADKPAAGDRLGSTMQAKAGLKDAGSGLKDSPSKKATPDRKARPAGGRAEAGKRDPYDDMIRKLPKELPKDWAQNTARDVNKALDEVVKQAETKAREKSQASGLKVERRLSARERAERKRVAKPHDGVGFAFGSDTPTKAEIDRWYAGLSDAHKKALKDPRTRITITTTASRPGSKEYNQNLTERRAQNTAKKVKERYGIQASIKLEAMGEEPASMRRAQEDRDDRTDRIAVITIEAAEPTKVQKDTKDKPTPIDHDDEKKRTTIPKEYQHGYQHSREWANNKFRQSVELVKQVLPFGKPSPRSLGTKYAKEVVKKVSDASRYAKEMEQAKDVHEKLWGVRPMNGFIFDKNKTSFRWRIESLLSEGGYDVKKMYPEYITHWLRKGAV